MKSARVVSPTGHGYLLLESHPAGCFRGVARMWDEVSAPGRPPARRPTALVIGASGGYGLAITVAGLARHGIDGVGVSVERPAGRRTASPGWYRTIATEAIARETGSDFSFRNADAFADTTKAETLDLLAERFGGVDYLIYSVAAPRRTDPRTGTTHRSVIKPLGTPYTTWSLEFSGDGAASLREAVHLPATEAETAATVRVMGGEDWGRWITALADRGLLRDGFRTVALTYIGSPITAPIYRAGTIGAAKRDLESTADALTKQLAEVGGHAYTSVNGAAVSHALTGTPGIPLYASLLRAVLGDRFPSPVEQSVELWEQLTTDRPDLDESGRIRLDRWELADPVQAAVTERWRTITPETLTELADIPWFRAQARSLYGFDVPGVDYDVPVETDLPWPNPS
ncbi:enoyl-[acyl-carrier-protein] reductase FabV [Actinomadura sp. NEAU-AAG7]|uniref:enoyl-[acyl-carrier-protein] reductase FabV n=1 Tax=Actinomadura sp. NEAU-AAG7 TaxID=2839640 RepID=UPI001BE4458A|nr:enoyl-[acyl-carrier-protein] reductase FabV [Actinomadura sp. NEAU-AAG7]MBT2206891.1 enoyl-[acyl-carrier-protein] reductase FabV [Actinomadura sp. NEAU-AAG7]